MNAPLPSAFTKPSPRRAWAFALLLAAAYFAAIGPTLSWTQFSSGNENIVTQTALEMRHGGPKLLPKLLGEPRVKKPPLVAWVTAAAMRPATVAKLDDLTQREAAYRELAWQTRWPALLAACVTLLATFEFARVWGGNDVALASAMAVGTNYLFFKYMRQSTTDAHLTAWVSVANACLLHGLLRGRWWAAGVGGGVALGLAFLCKGPVALVETIVPLVVAFVVLGRRTGDAVPADKAGRWVPTLVGVVLFLVIAVPWFVYVIRNVPDVARTWSNEVSREGATNLEVGNPVTYAFLGFETMPWAIFGAVGLLLLWRRRRERAAWLPFIFAVVPLLVMVWFRDRKERYMLPMIGPASVICGYAVATWVRGWTRHRSRGDVALAAGHGLLILGAALALPVLGVKLFKRVDGQPWFSPQLAVWAGVSVIALAGLVVMLLRRGRAWALPGGTFVVMLGVFVLVLFGYRDSADGRSPLKPLADAIRVQVPDATVYDWLPRGRADEGIAIYLNSTILRQDPASLVPYDRPIVVIARQAKQDGPPQLPEEFQLLATAKEGAATWFAYVRR